MINGKVLLILLFIEAISLKLKGSYINILKINNIWSYQI